MFFFGNTQSPAHAAEEKDGVRHVNAPEAAKLLDKDKAVVVLDIRTPREYKSGHIAGARNVDYRGSDFEAELGKLDKSKTYLVHCASGGRSGRSLKLFKKLKFKSIVHLDGGIRGWVADGQKVVK